MEQYDVAVVGAGPAGSSAARVAAEAGARVVVLDRAPFPRYKTCGGGLIGPSLAALPGTPPERAAVRRVSLTLRGARPRERATAEPCLRMVTRSELDAWLLDAARGAGEATRRYLRDFVAQLGMADLRVLHDSGHLTRCRTPDSPLGRGRVLLAGDAAGLLEPWTREGISFATRSGALAGAAAVGGPVGAVERYRAALARDLLPEMAVGETALRAFERSPAAFHELIGSTPVGWRSFVRIARGETTLARAVRHRTVRLALGALSRGSAVG